MLSSAVERAEVVSRPPPAAARLDEKERQTLRAELDALNLELRELKSMDHAVRAYVGTWVSFVSGSIAVKMLLDWQKAPAKTPAFALPFAVLFLVALCYTVTQRLKRRKLLAHEEPRLKRQRELRLLLGVDDAPVPPMPELAERPPLAQ